MAVIAAGWKYHVAGWPVTALATVRTALLGIKTTINTTIIVPEDRKMGFMV
jgi:hypothetical protein